MLPFIKTRTRGKATCVFNVAVLELHVGLMISAQLSPTYRLSPSPQLSILLTATGSCFSARSPEKKEMTTTFTVLPSRSLWAGVSWELLALDIFTSAQFGSYRVKASPLFLSRFFSPGVRAVKTDLRFGGALQLSQVLDDADPGVLHRAPGTRARSC